VLDAADEVAFSTPWGGQEASASRGPHRTLARLRQQHARALGTVPAIACQMLEQRVDAPVLFLDQLRRVIALMQAEDVPELLFPAWPAEYPGDTPRCFHVTPFRPWSEGTRAAARETCAQSGVAYSRGDEADEQRILRGIWQEIGRANWVLVDLTGLNPNVALELGIAHALGKPCLNVYHASHDPDGHRPSKLFPSIEKDQVHSYTDADGHQNLRAQLAKFLRPGR
jgi:hypothetical protein